MAHLDDRTGTGLGIALSAVVTLVAVVFSATFGLSHPDDEVLPDPPAPVSMPHTLSVFEISMSFFRYNMDRR